MFWWILFYLSQEEKEKFSRREETLFKQEPPTKFKKSVKLLSNKNLEYKDVNQ